MKNLVLVAIVLAVVTPVWASNQITDDFNGSCDLTWAWIPVGGDEEYDISVANNQLELSAETTSGEAQSVGGIVMSGGNPVAYGSVFLSLDVNQDQNDNNSDQGLMAMVQANNSMYGLNYDPYLDTIELIYYDGSSFTDLDGDSMNSGDEQSLTLKFQALVVSSDVYLVGQAWDGTTLMGQCQYIVTSGLTGGGVGLYANYNTNGPSEDLEATMDNFLARTGLAGDADLDGDVDDTDVSIVYANYGTGQYWSEGDLDLDGDVDDTDVSIVYANYNSTSCGPVNVPEPATMGLLAVGGLWMLRRRKRK